jgi:hypothetical protein
MGNYGGYSWSARASDRWGHWGASILIASILAAIALGVQPPPAGSWIALALPLTLFAGVLVSWVKMRNHDRRLCERCARAMPLNAAETSHYLRHRFAVAHAAGRRGLLVPYLAVLLGSNALLLAGYPGRLGWALVQSSMIYLVLSYSAHRRFQPWCPQCRDGGGGQERFISPEPLPQGGRP